MFGCKKLPKNTVCLKLCFMQIKNIARKLFHSKYGFMELIIIIDF